MARRPPSGASTPPARPRPSASRRTTHRTGAARRAAQARAARKRRVAFWAGAGVVLLVGALIGVFTALGASSSSGATGQHHDVATATLAGPPGPEGVVLEGGPVLAPESTSATGGAVDGVACEPNEQVVYHVHTHLSVYVDGVLRPIPGGIGIVSPVAENTAEGPFYGASTCYYWLHVHAQDGVIHIESPSITTYTLGQFFAIWGQPLSSTQVGPVHGLVTTFVDGRRFRGDLTDIGLGSHEDVQIDVGAPVVAPQKVDWSNSGL